MEMTLNELLDYLIDVRPCEEPPTPDSKEATLPPSLAEDTEESEDFLCCNNATVAIRMKHCDAMKVLTWNLDGN